MVVANPLHSVMLRMIDRLGGGPGALTNAADAVRRDEIVARQRALAWEALTSTRPDRAAGSAPDAGR